jgi:hypothetical protein
MLRWTCTSSKHIEPRLAVNDTPLFHLRTQTHDSTSTPELRLLQPSQNHQLTFAAPSKQLYLCGRYLTDIDVQQ